MSTSYMNETEIAGGGTAGFGVMGLVIFLILLFLVFAGKGWGHNAEHGAYNACACAGVSNCTVDKDVISAQYKNEIMTIANADRVIANANARAQLEDERLINSQALENAMLKGQIYNDAKFNAVNDKFAMVMAELCKKPSAYPVYAQGAVPAGNSIPLGGCYSGYNGCC